MAARALDSTCVQPSGTTGISGLDLRREASRSVSMKEGSPQVEAKDTAQAKTEEFMYADESPEYWNELAERRCEILDTFERDLNLTEEDKTFLAQVRDGLVKRAERAEEAEKTND